MKGGEYLNTKTCTTCKRELPLEMFYKKNTTKDGLTYFCKECAKEKRDKIKDKLNQRAKIYNETHKKERQQTIKNHYKRNKKRLNKLRVERRQQNKQQYNEYMRMFRNKNNAIAKQLEHTLTKKQWEKIKKSFDYKCANCGEKT